MTRESQHSSEAMPFRFPDTSDPAGALALSDGARGHSPNVFVRPPFDYAGSTFAIHWL